MNEYKRALELYLKDYFKRFGDKPHSGDDLRMFFQDSNYYNSAFERYDNAFVFRSMLKELGYVCVNRKCGTLGKWANARK